MMGDRADLSNAQVMAVKGTEQIAATLKYGFVKMSEAKM